MTTARATVFDWSRHDLVSGKLPLFIGGSLFVHVVAFFALQVVYQPTVAQFPSDARMVLLTPNTTSPAFLSWVESNDPANVFSQSSADRGAVELLSYAPSYNSGRLPLKGNFAMRTTSPGDGAFPDDQSVPIKVRGTATPAKTDRPAATAYVAEALLNKELAAAFGSSRLVVARFDKPAAARTARYGYVWQRGAIGPTIIMVESTGDVAIDRSISDGVKLLRPVKDGDWAGELRIEFRGVDSAGKPGGS
jgi:hypothetical protein